MTPYTSPIPFVDAQGRLTIAAREWIAKLVAELAAKDAAITALEARIAALEAA